MRRSNEDLTAMAHAIGGNQTAAKQWLDEGFSPGDAKAYVDAGCFDIPRTSELRQAGVSPLDIARTGLAWDFCSGAISLTELQRIITPTAADEEAELLLVEC
jgi:hypothetical protein